MSESLEEYASSTGLSAGSPEGQTAAQALDVFGCALTGRHLVEASAGTGKTWNLCALYLRLLLEDELAIEKILVVTFTNAATAELRDRIRARMVQCREALHSRQVHPDAFIEGLLVRLNALGIPPEQQLARIEQALASFDEASIFTIHGFCQRALADAPFSAGQALSLDVIQDAQALQSEVVADFWREHVLSNKASRALLDHVLQSNLTPEHLRKDLMQVLARPTSRLIWPDSPTPVQEKTLPDLPNCFELLKALWFGRQNEWQAGFAADRPGLNGKTFGKDKFKLDLSIEAWDQWLSQSEPCLPMPDEERRKLLTLLTPGRYTLNKGYASSLSPELLAATGTLIEALEAQRSLGAALWMQLRKQAIAELPVRLNRLKRARQLQGFDDMLSNLHTQLQLDASGTLTRALQERFQAALIDEFQDTDPLQFEIFDQLFSSPQSRLFLLGDPKQAIYSFRNADLHTYLHARTTVAHEHTLNTNQRSTPELISALNHFFSANPQAFVLPGVQYRHVQAGQRERAVFKDERVDLLTTQAESLRQASLTVWHLPGPDPMAMKDRRQAEQLSAQACAMEIASLLHGARRGQVRLDDRPLSGSDIAVLVRTHVEGERIRQALLARGLASVSIAQESVHKSIDALELERVLDSVIEPGQRSRLRVALSTDLIGESAATLVALQHDDALLAHWSGRLHDWKNVWMRKGIASMLRLLMRELDLAGRWLSRTDGERRMTNLLHLLERLQEAAHEHPQPAALLEWLKRERIEGGGAETALLRLESDRDLVKVLTIHKCKGLEFPVVFCPFLWTTSITASNRGSGAGARYHDADDQPVIDLRSGNERGEAKAEVRSRIEAEIGAENVRLAYVALTRAVHRLYLICGQSLGGRRTDALEKRAAAGTSTLLNWMVTGGSDHFEVWGKAAQDPVGTHTAWKNWAAAHAQHIQFSELPAPVAVKSSERAHPVKSPEQPLEPPLEPPLERARDQSLAKTLEALPAPGFIGPSWRLGSYSSLVHGADAERS
ncbi:MAG: exodeoxyribonuclease beta chain RecB, partial [Pseudomonadota bacterium]